MAKKLDKIYDRLEVLHEYVQNEIADGLASASFLQRRLRLGYAQAARLIDRMEELGFVSALVGGKPRKIFPAAKEFSGRTCTIL